MKYLLLIFALLTSTTWAGDSYALYKYGTEEYINKHDTERVRGIASITKLFTALTILNSGQSLTEKISVKCNSRSYLRRNTEITRQDLITIMIVASDNCAAETLANLHPGGFSNFIVDRNALIKIWGLKNTSLHDASGLSVFNVSTIDDLIKFVAIAYGNNVIREISNLKEAKLSIWNKQSKTSITVRNTNPAIFKHSDIALSKTGYTIAAGRCVVMLVKRLENYYAVVVLGEPDLRSRSKQVEKLLSYNETSFR